ERVVVYQTIPSGDPDAARRLCADHALDAVTFTSSSTVLHLVTLLGDNAARLLQHVVLASIGPITSATARELGLTVAVEAAEHTIPGLVSAMERYYLAERNDTDEH
ncbi:MAG TPA: uroporphyrinogen-III synthase, partial [Chloroflexota bacterium]|nr:uroporphyrinogen-III synthase [Chloroflexota bacterium]